MMLEWYYMVSGISVGGQQKPGPEKQGFCGLLTTPCSMLGVAADLWGYRWVAAGPNNSLSLPDNARVGSCCAG